MVRIKYLENIKVSRNCIIHAVTIKKNVKQREIPFHSIYSFDFTCESENSNLETP